MFQMMDGCPPSHLCNISGTAPPPPRNLLDAPPAAWHGLWQCTPGMAVLAQGLPPAQRTRAEPAVIPGICSGSIAEHSHPSLPKNARGIVRDYSLGKMKLVFQV